MTTDPAQPRRADAARQLALLATVASLDRRAWLCCAVALDTTQTGNAARETLDEIRSPEIRDRARILLDSLDDLTRTVPGLDDDQDDDGTPPAG